MSFPFVKLINNKEVYNFLLKLYTGSTCVENQQFI